MAQTGRNGRRPDPPSTSLIGREREQQHLDDLIDSRGLVTLTGRGGVGKSALALDAAERRRRSGSQLVAVVPLASIVDPLAVIDQVAATVGVRGASGDPLSALVRRLRRRPTLLVLDNAEHLTAAGPEIRRLIAEVPDLSVVVTSQRRLGVRGERTLPIRPLETPAPGSTDVDEIATSPAVTLYLERAAAVSGPWAPPPDLHQVGELCRRLEGLPLAIELAASRVTTLGPGPIASGDDRSVVDVLRQGPSDAPARHRDLRATLAWSYDLLDPGAQRLLRVLALVHHPPSFDTVDALATTARSGAATVAVDSGASTAEPASAIEPLTSGRPATPTSAGTEASVGASPWRPRVRSAGPVVRAANMIGTPVRVERAAASSASGATHAPAGPQSSHARHHDTGPVTSSAGGASIVDPGRDRSSSWRTSPRFRSTTAAYDNPSSSARSGESPRPSLGAFNSVTQTRPSSNTPNRSTLPARSACRAFNGTW